ncbi:MAG TPA: DUF6364 family protein [Pseudonocardiaceae bacterium]|jgi:hypothetical protein
MKRNLTIQLDEDIIKEIKAVAARRGTSVSGLVSAYLSQLAGEDAAYERARKAALELLDEAVDRGEWKWRREDAYAERLNRYGR